MSRFLCKLLSRWGDYPGEASAIQQTITTYLRQWAKQWAYSHHWSSFTTHGWPGALLTWGKPGTRVHYGKKASWQRQCDVLSNVLLGNLVDVTLTFTTYLSIVADHVQYFMEMVFPDGCGLFQQNDAPCHKAKTVQEWFEEQSNAFEMLILVPNSSALNPLERLWDVLDKQPTSKGCVANILQFRPHRSRLFCQQKMD